MPFSGRCGLGPAREDLFGAAGVAGDDLEGRLGQLEVFGQKFDAHFIGLAVCRWGGDFDLEGVALKPCEHIARRTGLHQDFEENALSGFPEYHVTGQLAFYSL